MIEGKVSESFDLLIDKWYNSTPSRTQRLEFLMDKLELSCKIEDLNQSRYQLFHRTFSAILTAEQYHANKAIMLVHSFSQTSEWFEDFAKFTNIINSKIEPKINEIYHCKTLTSGIELYLGWIKGNKKFLEK